MRGNESCGGAMLLHKCEAGLHVDGRTTLMVNDTKQVARWQYPRLTVWREISRTAKELHDE